MTRTVLYETPDWTSSSTDEVILNDDYRNYKKLYISMVNCTDGRVVTTYLSTSNLPLYTRSEAEGDGFGVYCGSNNLRPICGFFLRPDYHSPQYRYKRIIGIDYIGGHSSNSEPFVYYGTHATNDYNDNIKVALDMCNNDLERLDLIEFVGATLPYLFVQTSGNLFRYYSTKYVVKKTSDPCFVATTSKKITSSRQELISIGISDISADASWIENGNLGAGALTYTFVYKGRTWYLTRTVGNSTEISPPRLPAPQDAMYMGETQETEEGFINVGKQVIDLLVPFYGYPSEHLNN